MSTMGLARTQVHRLQTQDSYRGIPVHAPRLVHEKALSLVRSSLPQGSTVCDVGCGSGAMTQRLLESGYRVIPVDLDAGAFQVNGVDVLEGDFVEVSTALESHRVDMVLALEVIEHTENPLEFLRAVKRTAPQAIISFPNLQEIHNLIHFWRLGAFSWWNPSAYWDTGHQSILVDWLFEQHCLKVGMEIQEKLFVDRWRLVGLRSAVALLLARLASLCGIPFESRLSGSLVYRLCWTPN